MKITLESNPSDAPGCVKAVAEDGRDVLFQSDWDWPTIAQTFGWRLNAAQWPREDSDPCEHSGTDGTVACTRCGLPASNFIEAARAWIDDNDGAEVEDPGYFEEVEA